MEGIRVRNGRAPSSADPRDRAAAERYERVKQSADQVMLRQGELLREMRKRTTLDDDQIRELLTPFSEAAFHAGYTMGRAETEQDAADRLASAGTYKLLTFLLGAVIVAWLLTTAN